MPRNPQTTLFLKECIADALLSLLEEMPLERITVSQIVAAAGVGRATYFRYFHSKEDALVLKLEMLWDRYCDEHAILIRDRFDPGNAVDFFRFNHEIQHILTVLYAAGLEKTVFQAFRVIMLPEVDAPPDAWYPANFYAFGLFGLLDGWIRRNFRERPEEMAQITLDIIRQNEGAQKYDF